MGFYTGDPSELSPVKWKAVFLDDQGDGEVDFRLVNLRVPLTAVLLHGDLDAPQVLAAAPTPRPEDGAEEHE